MIRLLKIALALCLPVLLTTCYKDNSNLGGAEPSGILRSRIDGIQWNAGGIKSASRINGYIILTAGDVEGREVKITLKDSAVHTYMLHSTSIENVGVFIDSTLTATDPFATNQWYQDDVYGQVEISNIDPVSKRLSGSFRMSVFRTLDGQIRNFTDGVFLNIPYQDF
jgi:hypothetical protein